MQNIRVLFKADDPADPGLCTAGGDGGEASCVFLSCGALWERNLVERTQFPEWPNVPVCPKHGGYRQARMAGDKQYHSYLLGKWKQRVDGHAEHEMVLSLRGEIGIARLLLESTLESCKTATDLQIHSGRIQSLTITLERLIKTCAAQEVRMDHFLSDAVVMGYASRMVNILHEELQDPDLCERVVDRLVVAFQEEIEASKEAD